MIITDSSYLLYLQTLTIMRFLTAVVMCFFMNTVAFSQNHEIGIYVGGSNFIGDIGATNYISPNQIAFGGIYKWNRSERHSYRISLIATNLQGIDTKSDDPRRIQRGYSFTNNIIELSAGMEFTFVDFNLHKPGVKSTPYLYSGVSIASFDNYFYTANGERRSENTSSYAYGIPMVLGYKTTLTDQLILAFEVGARYTFTDEIDGSVPDAEERVNLSVGNVNNNDWYVFTGATLTFTFGRNPCYCFD